MASVAIDREDLAGTEGTLRVAPVPGQLRWLRPGSLPVTANRLVDARSDYLLQHAHQAINWWQWGADAFAHAAEVDKPVMLSVGYASCRWCHVMSHESFEDAQVAAYLNEHFVAIKVDRQQHPDVGAVYMAATQALNHGAGGASVATPDLRAAVDTIEAQFDLIHCGFGTAPKFPMATVRDAARFLAARHVVDSELRRISLGGVAADPVGTAEDHGSVAEAFATFAGITGDAGWLRRAEALVDHAIELFGADDGGFHDAAASDLFNRPRSLTDHVSLSRTSSLVAAPGGCALGARRPARACGGGCRS